MLMQMEDAKDFYQPINLLAEEGAPPHACNPNTPAEAEPGCSSAFITPPPSPASSSMRDLAAAAAGRSSMEDGVAAAAARVLRSRLQLGWPPGSPARPVLNGHAQQDGHAA